MPASMRCQGTRSVSIPLFIFPYELLSTFRSTLFPPCYQELGDGHYFINDGLLIDKPIKFVGDEDEPSHVILELSGTIVWKSYGGWMEGMTIRRSSLAKAVSHKNEILRIDSGGRLDVFNCVFDNRGCIGNCTSIGIDARARWEKAVISGGSEDSCGLRIGKNAKVQLIDVSV